MLLKPYNALFVHVPKTAGQSIENFFLKQLGKTRFDDRKHFLLAPNNDPKKGPPRLAHLNATDYVKFGYLSPMEFQNYFKFAFVRNPFERAVSFYKFYGFNGLVSFNTFILKYFSSYFETENWFFKNQVDFIYKNEVLMVDFVGRYEKLDTDFKKIASSLKIAEDVLPKSNISEIKRYSRKSFNVIKKHPDILFHFNHRNKQNEDYTQIYSSEGKKIVSKFYEKDIDILKYTF